MPIEIQVPGSIWDRCSQIVLSQAYFWSSPLDCSPMQWKSLHNGHFYQSFKNSPSALHHTSKASSYVQYLIKKESNLHKIRKWLFPPITVIFLVQDQKIISESKLLNIISFQTGSFQVKMMPFLHVFGIQLFCNLFQAKIASKIDFSSPY